MSEDTVRAATAQADEMGISLSEYVRQVLHLALDDDFDPVVKIDDHLNVKLPPDLVKKLRKEAQTERVPLEHVIYKLLNVGGG